MLVTIILMILSCHKNEDDSANTIPVPSQSVRPWQQYKDRFLGTYQWSYYTYFKVSASSSPADSVQRPDTAFAISEINDSTLAIWNYKLSYSDSIYYSFPGYGYLNDTANTLYYFDHIFFSPSHNNASLYFGRKTDSLFFVIETNSLGAKYKRVFYTKIH